MKKPAQHLIAEVSRRQAKVEITIGIDLGDVWSHDYTLNQDGEVDDRGCFRTTPKSIEKWFTDLPRARVAMEAGTHSIWISEQLQELGHDVIVANVRELRAISHRDRKSDQVDAGTICPARSEHPPANCPQDRRTAGGTHPDPCASSFGSAAHGSSERGSWSNEGLRLPQGRLRHNVLRSAQPRCHAVWTGTGARTGAPADYGDDSQDQAVRPADPAARPAQVCGDPGPAEGSRRWPPYRFDLRTDPRQHGTVRTKSRCGLLPWLATAAKSIRRPRASAWHHSRRQGLPSKSADRVLQPHPPAARTRLGAGLHLAGKGGKQAKSKAVVALARTLAVLLHRLWTTQEPTMPFYE